MSNWAFERFYHTIINAKNLDETVAFYRLLGFEVLHDSFDAFLSIPEVRCLLFRCLLLVRWLLLFGCVLFRVVVSRVVRMQFHE